MGQGGDVFVFLFYYLCQVQFWVDLDVELGEFVIVCCGVQF